MRLRICTVVVSTLLATCTPTGKGAEPERSERSIVLSSKEPPLASFGRVVLLKVSYRNQGNTPWIVRTPEVSGSTELRRHLVGSNRLVGGYHLGKAPPRPASYYAHGDKLELIVGDPLTIPPGEIHDFALALEQGWTGDVLPGTWEVWIRDSNANLESNRLRIPLRFTADSITACLESVADREQRRSRRKWHAAWLQRVMPELELRWWTAIASPEEREKAEAVMARRLGEFRTFLADPKNEAAIQAAIDRINREAGLPVEEGKPVAGGH